MNDEGQGCLGILAICVVGVFIVGNIALFTGTTQGIEWIVFISVVCDILLALWAIDWTRKKIQSVNESIYEKKLLEKKGIVIQVINEKMLCKNAICQSIEKHFEGMEQQVSFLRLIASCAETDSKELETLLVMGKSASLQKVKKEVFGQLSPEEKQRFPQSAADISTYKKTLKKEMEALKADLRGVASTNKESIAAILQKHGVEPIEKSPRRR